MNTTIRVETVTELTDDADIREAIKNSTFDRMHKGKTIQAAVNECQLIVKCHIGLARYRELKS